MKTTLIFLFVLTSLVCRGGELPASLFWPSEAAFLSQVEDGQLDAHLELHLLEYSADPRWASEWAARRYAGNGLFGEYGSTTATNLFVNNQIAVNVFPSKAFQVRYDRRDYQDGRFDVADQRFDLMWYPAPGWAVVVTGWPTHLKEQASLGAGFRIGEQKGRSSLEVRVVDDRVVWDEKTKGEVKLTSQPVRIVADGFLESGPWVFRGSVDYGLEYEAAEPPAVPGAQRRSTRGFQRFADLAAEYGSRGWAAGGRLTLASLGRGQDDPGGTTCALDRTWSRALVYFRKELGRWTVHALAGFATQRDSFSSDSVPSGSYRMDTPLFGAEGSLSVGKGLDLRLGYLGSAFSAERSVSIPGPLPDAGESGWFDKAHVRALYAFSPGMSIELLLSQSLSRSSFGGGSVKALFVF